MYIDKHLALEQKTVYELFAWHSQKFVIPSYQRPYAWTEEQCQTFLDDLLDFAFPSDKEFERDHDAYFLGDITVYHNKQGLDELVDGQQRVITLSLLLRALYNIVEDKRDLGRCLWYTSERGEADCTRLKIEWTKLGGTVDNSLKNILIVGVAVKKDTSQFATNYKFFQQAIKDWTPEQQEAFAHRLLENVYLIKRIATDLDEALTMFITINDRGKSLAIEDIFKAELCNDAYAKGGMKACNEFVEYWDSLVKRCDNLFSHDEKLSPIAFAFLIYAYQFGKKYDWREMKKFYSANKYSQLKAPQTLVDIESMIDFFEKVTGEVDNAFDKSTLRKVALCRSFNLASAWYLLGLFFLKTKGAADFNAQFDAFTDRLLAFYVGAAACGELYLVNPPYKAIPSMPCLLGEETPDNWFSAQVIHNSFADPANNLSNMKLAQRLIMSWWYFRENNEMIPAKKMQIEHIFSKALAETRELDNPALIESFGNIALLEGKINGKAKNHRFIDKKKFYLEYGGVGTANVELQRLARTKNDFAEEDIIQRNESILNAILDLLRAQDFLRE